MCVFLWPAPATAGCERHGGWHHPQVQGQVHHISAVQATWRQQQQQLGSSWRRQAHAPAAAVRGAAAAAAATAAPLRRPLLVQFFPAQPACVRTVCVCTPAEQGCLHLWLGDSKPPRLARQHICACNSWVVSAPAPRVVCVWMRNCCGALFTSWCPQAGGGWT